MAGWLTDLLLESPVPPSNWLPSRAQRLADARSTLRRRFGRERETAGRRTYYLNDLNRVHSGFGSSRAVNGARIEADLESDITSINPPVMQGWVLLVTLAAAWFALVGMAELGAPNADGTGWMTLGKSVGGWALVVGAVAWLQRMIELDDDGVHVRRWADVWLRRRGQLLGAPESLTARLVGRSHLILERPGAACSIRLWLWPPTARDDLTDELPIWGVDSTFDPHRHPRRGAARRGRSDRTALD